MSARALVAVTVLAALIVLASSFIRGSGLLAFFLSTEDVPFKQAECTRIAALIAAGRLEPDTAGIVVFPTGIFRATIDGRVYVTRKSGKRMSVLFAMSEGHDSNLQGYLHSSRPLTKDDTETCPKGNGPEIIELTGPGVWYHPRKYSGQVGYTLGRRVGPNR